MISRVGRLDPIRTAGGGPGASNPSKEIGGLRSAGPTQGPFLRVIVHEILGDLSRLSKEEIDALGSEVPGGSLSILKAPRNSIIAIPVSGPSQTNQKILCYPFFPPHLSMPAKPGEQVWAIQEASTPDQVGFWLCRVSEGNFLDDVNFTHSDRKFAVYIDKVTTDTASSAAGDSGGGEETRPFDGLKETDKSPGPPDFSFGPTSDTDVVTPSITDPSGENPNQTRNPYDVIYTGSFSLQTFTMEPVPRFTKRPGDLVFQGSNNTLICLGQDRGWTAVDRPDTTLHSNAFSDVNNGSATEPPSDFCGTIDIVSGRGRFFSQSPPDPDNAQIKDTQPRVILNSRDKLEVDKNPACYVNDPQRSSIETNRLDRPQEGDPDFLTDASRIYISMKTSGDANFNITSDIVYPAFEGEITNAENSPFIVMKSDEIRIIARKESERDTINGGIRIIKEGDINDDMAVIYMMPSGVIQISGNKIYMGQPDQGNGPGEKKSEPFIKYSELEKLLTKTYDAIDQFCQKLLTHTTPGYGAPSIQIVQGATGLQMEIQQRKQEIASLKSTRVFGE